MRIFSVKVIRRVCWGKDL